MTRCLLFFALSLLSASAQQAAVYDVQPDLALPATLAGEPAAGKRVRTTTQGWEMTSVYHALYLPGDWQPGQKKLLPVIVEFPGNGGYQRGDDVSHGTPENCHIGYGLTAGEGAIWVCLPFVDARHGKQVATAWWGDVAETKRYCLATVAEVCTRYGGDRSRVLLAGFSRGAIACNFIGLHDDEIAGQWRGFFCHSHYDGVKESWPYPGADRAAAKVRLLRLKGRPQWISHEGSVAETEKYLHGTRIKGDWAFHPLPFPNHTDEWLLRPLPLRDEARAWYRALMQ
jgi:hypothetical protein